MTFALLSSVLYVLQNKKLIAGSDPTLPTVAKTLERMEMKKIPFQCTAVAVCAWRRVKEKELLARERS